jgi:DNA phosphorothioation-associated putative methyltransferase
VRGAASGPRVGKRVGGVLYVHRSALDLLEPDLCQRIVTAAELENASWNVVKIERWSLSLLLYEDFDGSAFPSLLESVRVDGDRFARTDYRKRENPPILHRKELLLRLDDERVPLFASLTLSAESHGLFVAPHRIGTQQAWAKRISEAGLTLEGHTLVPSDPVPMEIARHRTAIVRNRLSAPMQLLVRHDFVRPGVAVLDYGCGQGDDVRALLDGGVEAAGWDPHFLPDGTLAWADAVNLGFVLNVIEDPGERLETLRRAWSYCGRVLAVAVMVAGHRPTAGLRPYGDGFVTSRGTFQRYFTPAELKDVVREALGVEGFAVGLGVVFAFRDAADERDFLFRRQVRRSERTVSFRPPPRERSVPRREPLVERIRPTLETLWRSLLDLGRVPVLDEVPSDVAKVLRQSNVSLSRAIALCEDIYEREDFTNAAHERKEDLLLYFALGAFSKSVALSDLASGLQRDARVFFGGVAKAKEAALAYLFTLRDERRVKEACERAVETGIASQRRGGHTFSNGPKGRPAPPSPWPRRMCKRPVR